MGSVSASVLDNLYKRYNSKEVRPLFIGNGEDRFEFEVKHRLSVDEVTDIVADVCNEVVNTETGDYRPELKDYFLRVAVLKTYTNLTLPQGEKCWWLVYATPVFAMITGHDRRPVAFDGRDYDDNMVIDVEQYEQIIAAIDQRITYAIMHNSLHGIVASYNGNSDDAKNSRDSSRGTSSLG